MSFEEEDRFKIAFIGWNEKTTVRSIENYLNIIIEIRNIYDESIIYVMEQIPGSSNKPYE